MVEICLYGLRTDLAAERYRARKMLPIKIFGIRSREVIDAWIQKVKKK